MTTRVRKTVRTATGRTRVVTSSLGVGTASAGQRIDDLIATVGGWRGERLAELRALIHEVDPDVVEDWKWMGTPVWSHDGMYVLANAHKGKVKLQFFHGAQLPDPKQLFNAGLGGGKWRAIDLHAPRGREGVTPEYRLSRAVPCRASRVPTEQCSRSDLCRSAKDAGGQPVFAGCQRRAVGWHAPFLSARLRRGPVRYGRIGQPTMTAPTGDQRRAREDCGNRYLSSPALSHGRSSHLPPCATGDERAFLLQLCDTSQCACTARREPELPPGDQVHRRPARDVLLHAVA